MDYFYKEENSVSVAHYVLNMKRFFLIFFIVILTILIVVSGVGIGFYINKMSKIDFVDISKEEIEISSGIEDKLSKYRNIVLFGIDSAKGYEGRSDCIIILSLNEETNEVKMTSVYRDTYVKVDGYGYTKINHAYAYGGAKLAINTLNKNLDLNISEFVTINFRVVEDIVNAVGGVKIKVTAAEATQITGINSAGTYNLTGKQALEYGRIRKIDSDYQRTERMRTVIEGVFNKVKGMSLTKLNKLVDKILPEVKTNITMGEITEMLTLLPSIKIGESTGWPYQTTGRTIDGVWYGVPKTLESSVKKLHQELFDDKEYETTENVKNISKTIINKTGVK